MTPDYEKHAREFIDRLKLKKPAQGQQGASPATHVYINAPKDCVFYIVNEPPRPASPAPEGGG